MKILSIVLTGLIALLSIAAGAAKVMQVPDEMAFLGGLGLSGSMILAFGAFQIIGGILTIIPKSKTFGSIILVIGFAISAVLVFSSGNIKFGLISIVPVILGGIITYTSIKSSRSQSI